MQPPVQIAITPNKFAHISDKPYDCIGFKHLHREVINDVGELVRIPYRDCTFVNSSTKSLLDM